MRERLRARIGSARRHPGQVLIIFALLAPAMIAMIGLGIDTAYVFKERRQLQNVADLAALGGVGLLPGNSAGAESTAAQIAILNGVTEESVTANAGYDGDDSKLEISVSQQVGLFFMPALGIDSVTISARAVAEHTSGKGTAVFAKKDTHCWAYAINWTGNNINVDGDAHSNAALTISGRDNTLTGDLSYQGYPVRDCKSSVTEKPGTNPNLPKASGGPWTDWPINYSSSDFPCTYTLSNPNIGVDGSHWVGGKASSKQLKSGTICYNGTSWMTLSGTGITGNVTIKAKNIRLTLTNSDLTAYANEVVVYSTGTSFPSLELNMNGGTLNGIVYERAPVNPNQGGQVVVNGSNNFRLNGSIVSWAVTLAGNNWSIVNILEGTTEPAHLVE